LKKIIYKLSLCSFMLLVLVIIRWQIGIDDSSRLWVMILELISKWLTLKSHILIHNNPEAWGFVFIWYSNKSLSVSFKRSLSKKKILLLLKIEKNEKLDLWRDKLCRTEFFHDCLSGSTRIIFRYVFYHAENFRILDNHVNKVFTGG